MDKNGIIKDTIKEGIPGISDEEIKRTMEDMKSSTNDDVLKKYGFSDEMIELMKDIIENSGESQKEDEQLMNRIIPGF